MWKRDNNQISTPFTHIFTKRLVFIIAFFRQSHFKAFTVHTSYIFHTRSWSVRIDYFQNRFLWPLKSPRAVLASKNLLYTSYSNHEITFGPNMQHCGSLTQFNINQTIRIIFQIAKKYTILIPNRFRFKIFQRIYLERSIEFLSIFLPTHRSWTIVMLKKFQNDPFQLTGVLFPNVCCYFAQLASEFPALPNRIVLAASMALALNTLADGVPAFL